MHRLLTGPLTVERVQVPIADLPAHLEGLTLTQLSDFHFDGWHLSEELLAEAIAASNAAEPDLVLLTGDFITDDPGPIHDLVRWLKGLQSRAGVYAVLGNHDLHQRRSRQIVTHAFSQAGIRVLWNEIAYPLGPELPLVGLADQWSREFQPASVMAQLDPAMPRLVLSHNPDSAAVLQQWRVDLQLSGHSHGGQIVLPAIGNLSQLLAGLYRLIPKPLKWLFPWLSAFDHTLRHWEWVQGLHRVGNNQLYVNRGLGTYLPGRLFCPPEVTVITLVGGNESV